MCAGFEDRPQSLWLIKYSRRTDVEASGAVAMVVRTRSISGKVWRTVLVEKEEDGGKY